jgi:hypothetical protein
MAELLDLHKEFHLGNKFTLNVATHLAEMLSDEYRVIIKYDSLELPHFNDDIKNVIISTSNEAHPIPKNLFDDNVFAIFQNYFLLDRWGDPIYNPVAYPLPIGTFIDFDDMPELKPLPERKYDFSFIGQIPHTGTRDGFKRNLDKFIKDHGKKFNFFVEYTDGFAEGLNTKEYMDLLNDSKIVLCPSGAWSKETFRFFEILKMGALPMVESLPKFWYYLTAPMFHAVWQRLEYCIPLSLNYIHSNRCKTIVDKIINYNINVLDEINLAKHLYEKVQLKNLMDKDEIKAELQNIKDTYNVGN